MAEPLYVAVMNILRGHDSAVAVIAVAVIAAIAAVLLVVGTRGPSKAEAKAAYEKCFKEGIEAQVARHESPWGPTFDKCTRREVGESGEEVSEVVDPVEDLQPCNVVWKIGHQFNPMTSRAECRTDSSHRFRPDFHGCSLTPFWVGPSDQLLHYVPHSKGLFEVIDGYSRDPKTGRSFLEEALKRCPGPL